MKQSVEAGHLLRPFHETIVEDILIATNEEMVFIASQLKKSLVPANHDQIIMAWNKRRKVMCWADEQDLEVSASLLRQKQAVEAGAMAVSEPGVYLGKLQVAAESFLVLSRNGHSSGSMIPWHVRLREQLQNLHRLTAQALGKK